MKDLTKGSPSRLILSFAIPIFFANLLQLTYSLVDTRIVGSFLGEDALAAVGATSTLSNLIIGFLLGLANGFAIITAQRYGAKDIAGVKKSFAASLMMGTGISVLLTAAGLTPYSVEALSCFIAGTKCEQIFLRKTEEEGFPETMCSYHRVFLGAALTGILPAPKCMIYTNLACDGNMMTFPYLKENYSCPGFYIDVPYEKTQSSIKYVANQLKELKHFLEDITKKKITEEAVENAVTNSRKAAAHFRSQLALRKDHDPVTSLTNELYAIFMCHLLAGSETSLKYTELLLEDVKNAPKGEGLHVLWMHIMPFLQQPVKEAFNYSKTMHISACDFVADGFREMQAADPYEAMAEKMVHCIYNGSVKERIRMAEKLAKQTDADGGILFAHWGCKGTIGASGLIKNVLETAGLPTMILDGDGCNPANTSDGQVSTRLQAFAEMLEKNKEEKHS